MNQTSGRPLCVHVLPDTVSAGAENQARALIAGLRSSDELDVELAYFAAGGAHPEFVRVGVPMREFPRSPRFRFLGSVRGMRRAYRARPPDILHTWLLEGNIAGLLAARRWPSTRVVIGQRGSWNELDYRAHVRIQRVLMRGADHAISNSAGGSAMLARLGFPRNRISVIPNGISAERVRVTEDREALRTRHGWSDRELVAWVGRSNDPAALHQKDLGAMLGAMDRLHADRPRALLVLIGVDREGVAAMGHALPEWAVALGWTDRIADYLNAADLLAISSRTEGHSNAAGEALMLGLPVATTASGDHAAVVQRAGGKVTPVGDAGALAGAIGALLDEPPPRERVREIAERELSVERMVGSTLALYRRLLGS